MNEIEIEPLNCDMGDINIDNEKIELIKKSIIESLCIPSELIKKLENRSEHPSIEEIISIYK